MGTYSYNRKGRQERLKGSLKSFMKRLRPGKAHKFARGFISNARRMNGKSIPDFVRKNLIDSLSFKKIFLIWIMIIIAFGLVFSFLEYASPENGLSGLSSESPMEIVLNSIYFSFITATSTGFGDITPLGISRIISVIEAVSGLIMFGIVISKLVSFKQESIIREIYEISFDEKVSRLRSVLYLPRSDMDNLLHRITESRAPRGSSDNLWSALNSINEALSDIQKVTCISNRKGNFLKSVGHLQMELILNSTTLTLNKLNELLAHLDEVSYKWRTERNVGMIKQIVSAVDDICGYHKISNQSQNVMKRITELEGARGALGRRVSA